MADPVEPPPLIRTVAASGDTENPDDQGDWEVFDAQIKTKDLKAVFANRVYVSHGDSYLRVTFGEHVSDENVFHTALAIPLEEAGRIGQLLVDMSEAGLARLWDQYSKVFQSLDAETKNADG